MTRGFWLVLCSLAIASVMLACGARTGLRTESEPPASDATVDHAIDPRDVTADTRDAGDASDADAPNTYDGPFALCGVCSADLNANEVPVGTNQYQGATWLAYEMPIACDQFAAWIAVHVDTAAIRAYADDGTGKPGAEVLPPTPTQPMGDAGWFVAPASVQLQGGRSYFVATSITPYYANGSTHTSWSVSGVVTRYYGSFGSGPWEGPYSNPAMLRAGDCE